MQRWPILLVIFVLATPVGAGIPAVGSEEEPEVSDVEGDQSYSQTYVGPRDKQNVDLISAWVDHDDDLSTYRFTAKLADLEDVESRVGSDRFLFAVESTVFAGDRAEGELFVGIRYQNGQWAAGGSFYPVGRPEQTIEAVSFDVQRTSPGFLRASFAAADLERVGESLGEFHVRIEQVNAIENNSLVGGARVYEITDTADANSVYRLTSSTQPNATPEMWTTEDGLASETAQTNAENPDTAAGGSVFSLIIVAGAAMFLAMRRRAG